VLFSRRGKLSVLTRHWKLSNNNTTSCTV